MMTMKIETIELTVPQRRLMEIFAKLDGNGDFDDKRVRRLLEYMRELLNQEKVQSKTLGEMLDGTLPPIDFYGYYDATMRDLYECDSDCYSPAPDELSEADYQDSLIQCFPKIILELLPKPEKWIDPAKNLILTWEMTDMFTTRCGMLPKKPAGFFVSFLITLKFVPAAGHL